MMLIITEQYKVPNLAEAQKHVGGYVESLYIPKKGILLFNEDGKFQNLSENKTASHLAGVTILGNAIFLPYPIKWGT